MSKEESYSNDGIECPYCGALETDDLPYDDGSTLDWDCTSCDKKFEVYVSCSWNWAGTPTDTEAVES